MSTSATARESSEAEYIRLCGENLERTIAETWMDVGCPLNDRDSEGKLVPAVIERRAKLQAALEAVLRIHLSDLERAEWAAMLCGNVDYETWIQDQE
jgi:hypothetical protein